MNSMKTKQFAKNSDKSIKWALRAYNQWRCQALKGIEVDHRVVCSDLENPAMLVKSSLCYVLCRFVTEVNKLEGKDYPPNSIKNMLYCIQMYLKTKRLVWKLLDKTDEAFYDLAMVIDNELINRVTMGMGKVESAQPIARRMENLMWELGVLGDSNPSQLSDTLIFVLGIHLALRWGGGVRNTKH